MKTKVERVKIEIGLMVLLRSVLRNIRMIVISAIACGLLGVIISEFVVEKQYESTANMYIISRQSEGTATYSDSQTSTLLVNDYKSLVTTRAVVEQVIGNLDLDMEISEFINKISVSMATNSRILSITVTDTDPYMAKMMVDSLADVSSTSVCAVMELEGINIFEYGNIPTSPSSPNVKIYTVMGLLLGAILAIASIIIVYLVDDSIKTAEDVETYLGLSTLAIITLAEDEYNGESNRKKNKSKKNGQDRLFSKTASKEGT